MNAPDIVVTDHEFADLAVERSVLDAAGLPLRSAGTRDPDELAEQAAGATGLLVQYATIDGDLLDRLPEVRIVVRYGVGLDNVDLDAASARDVAVCNVLDYGTEEVAAHTAALLLATARRLGQHDRDVRAGGWDYRRAGAVPRLSTLTLGLVGLGRIGRLVAERVGMWFGEVIATDPFAPDEGWPADIERVQLDEVFERADALSLHLPLSEDTADLVDAERLERMPEGAILVNTSRGGLVDSAALCRALDDGRLRGAGLDVLPSEPPAPDDPIRTHPSVLLSPHVAWYSEQAETDLRRTAAEQLVEFHQGRRPAFLAVGPATASTR